MSEGQKFKSMKTSKEQGRLQKEDLSSKFKTIAVSISNGMTRTYSIRKRKNENQTADLETLLKQALNENKS